ncbi:MAG: methyltransferase domain-containing protein [Rhodobacteraceae bacterium]|nr:methyltransferase domain-containing protein [Paracoccaceae bacterium]
MEGDFENRDNAYALGSPAEHREYYDDWAPTYDKDFAGAVGYIYPKLVADCFLGHAGDTDQPVADLGCGTGLVGPLIAADGFTVDGLDISGEMLGQAAAKGAYRELITADLTERSSLAAARYGGLISCGTFTLGHLGPQELGNALRLARPQALCVTGINSLHFRQAGFQAFFDRLLQDNHIHSLSFETGPIYSGEDRAADINNATLAIFRTNGVT